MWNVGTYSRFRIPNCMLPDPVLRGGNVFQERRVIRKIVDRPTATVFLALCLTALVHAATSTSPVADAAMRGDREAVRALLKQGADVNAAQGDGMTALHHAAESGDAEMAGMLVYAGANVSATTRIGQYTPLHVASQGGHQQVVQTLLKAGANVGARTTTSGVTPLHLAAASGAAALVQ